MTVPLLLLLAIASHLAVMTSGIHDAIMGQEAHSAAASHGADRPGAGDWLTTTADSPDQCPAMTAAVPQATRLAAPMSLAVALMPANAEAGLGARQLVDEIRIRGSPRPDLLAWFQTYLI